MSKYVPSCKLCGESFSLARFKLGFAVCLPCGDGIAKEVASKRCVAPMHKSNYVLITDRADLVGLNNKGGLVK